MTSGSFTICCQVAHFAATLNASQPAAASYLPNHNEAKKRRRSKMPRHFPPPPFSALLKALNDVGNPCVTLQSRNFLQKRPTRAVMSIPQPIAKTSLIFGESVSHREKRNKGLPQDRPPLASPFVSRYFPPAVADLIIDVILIVVVAVCIGLSILLCDPKMMRRLNPK